MPLMSEAVSAAQLSRQQMERCREVCDQIRSYQISSFASPHARRHMPAVQLTWQRVNHAVRYAHESAHLLPEAALHKLQLGQRRQPGPGRRLGLLLGLVQGLGLGLQQLGLGLTAKARYALCAMLAMAWCMSCCRVRQHFHSRLQQRQCVAVPVTVRVEAMAASLPLAGKATAAATAAAT